MESIMRGLGGFLLAFLVPQVAGVAVATDGGHDPCLPGFQVKVYQLAFSPVFQKGRPLLRVEFDDCLGNEDLKFWVSDPGFSVDQDLNLVPQRDVPYGETVLFIHGVSANADDTAKVEVSGETSQTTSTLRDLLSVGETTKTMKTASRSKRSLLVPPMIVTENQRAPFPRIIGKSHLISSDSSRVSRFVLKGPGADLRPRGLFTIDSDSGDVSVSRSLDREQQHSYQLEVSTTDFAGNVVEGPTPLLITVIDQNDNRPIFRDDRYTGEVLEGSPAGTTVMTMTAFDADDPNTDNAALRYNIIRQSPNKPSDNMFSIEPETGHIVTQIDHMLLDRETLPTTTYELEIVAKDMAGSEVGLTGTATATITITDKNDHAPEFTHPLFEAYTNEGTTGVVVNLTVDDRDDPETGAWRAVYSVVGDPERNFHIQTNPDNNEGMLSVVKPLDYESTPQHLLRLLIRVENEEALESSSGYGSSSTATVHVKVQDVNEGPEFRPDPLRVTKMENVPVGSYVASLNASDPDSFQTQTLRYSVLHDPAGWLSVNSVSGIVNTSSSLDRESIHVRDNKYTAVFIATDSGFPPATGTGSLVIHLEDFNDNAPQLAPAVAPVCEDELNVGLVGGWDRDLPPNAAPFTIQLAKQPDLDKTWKVTRVNATHSQITLLHSLKKNNYLVPLLISDSGTPPLSNSTELKVQVCVCSKNKMLCSSAHFLQRSGSLANAATLLATLLLARLCL